MADPIWTGYITKNQMFEVDKFDDLTLWLGRFAPGTQIDLVIRKHNDKCSRNQSKYYWAVIVKEIAEHTGHDTDEIHEFLKWKFLSYTDDKNLKMAKSTESLDTKEREEYHEKCRKWAMIVLDLNIPLPNEVDIGGSE